MNRAVESLSKNSRPRVSKWGYRKKAEIGVSHFARRMNAWIRTERCKGILPLHGLRCRQVRFAQHQRPREAKHKAGGSFDALHIRRQAPLPFRTDVCIRAFLRSRRATADIRKCVCVGIEQLDRVVPIVRVGNMQKLRLLRSSA